MNDSEVEPLYIGFDADDTLWHNEGLYRDAAATLRALFETESQAESVLAALADLEVRNIQWYGYGIKSYTLSMIEAAVSASDGRVATRVIDSILQIGRDMLRADVVLFEHASATLQSLAEHHALMLITKGDLLEQGQKLRRSGLAELFDFVEIIQDKDAASYKSLLERHKIPVERFVMVGNSLKSDIVPVLEIGGRAVYVPYEHTWAHEHVEATDHSFHEIGDLSQLPGLIASWDA